MDVEVPSPQTTLLILLGASEWPFMAEFQRSEAFANAARRLKAYFLNPRPFGLPAENLLDLFDSDKSADNLDMEIGQFLQKRLIAMKAMGNAARDLLFYFVGHGGFVGRDSDFYLAIRCTRTENPQASGLQMESLAYTLTDRARYLRRIIILDCCFAAAAFSAFQGGPDQVALQKTRDAFHVGHKTMGFPSKGTTLLCSSNQRSPSLLMPDSSSTMFTKAFLDALVQGTPSQQDRLTLRDVKDLATDFLSEIRNAPKPVVHSPDQSEGDVADIPFFPNPRIEEERLRRAEEARLRQAEEDRARKEEEERLRKAEEKRVREAEEQVRKIEEEERARQVEEWRRRRAEQEARAHQAEENRLRQAEEERLRKTQEPQFNEWLFRDPVVLKTETPGFDLQRSMEPIRAKSYNALLPALGRQQNGRGRFFYPTLGFIALLVILLIGGGGFYFLRSNASQTANQALDIVQQQMSHTQTTVHNDPTGALATLSSVQKTLVDVQKNSQLDQTQQQRITQLQNDLVSQVKVAISTYNQQSKINVLPCNNSKSHPIDNSSSQTSPENIAFADGSTINPFLYTLGINNLLYLFNSHYSMVSPLPSGKNTPQFVDMGSNGSSLFLMQKQMNGTSQATYILNVYQPDQQGSMSVPLSSAQIGANFTTNGYTPVFITAWGNTVYVMLSSQSDQGNARILSYVLDTNEHLSTPKETQISISAPIVSIAAFPSQLFLLLASGEVQSLSLVSGIQPSSLPMPVLVQPQIAPPLATNASNYSVKDTVPTVTTTVNQNGSSPTQLSIPSTSQANPALLTAGQINGVPHLYIGDPVNHRVINLEYSPGGSNTPTATGTTGTTNSVKLTLDQQYVSYLDFKQMKSLAADRQGDQLAVLSQTTTSMTILVSMSTGTPTGCA